VGGVSVSEDCGGWVSTCSSLAKEQAGARQAKDGMGAEGLERRPTADCLRAHRTVHTVRTTMEKWIVICHLVHHYSQS
jgi:hypothetical protein